MMEQVLRLPFVNIIHFPMQLAHAYQSSMNSRCLHIFTDIDECTKGVSNCSVHLDFCINSIGGYECYKRDRLHPDRCPDGYRKSGDNKACDGS